MNLYEAKKILNKKGFRLIKEAIKKRTSCIFKPKYAYINVSGDEYISDGEYFAEDVKAYATMIFDGDKTFIDPESLFIIPNETWFDPDGNEITDDDIEPDLRHYLIKYMLDPVNIKKWEIDGINSPRFNITEAIEIIEDYGLTVGDEIIEKRTGRRPIFLGDKKVGEVDRVEVLIYLTRYKGHCNQIIHYATSDKKYLHEAIQTLLELEKKEGI